jgi:hypothetical protein
LFVCSTNFNPNDFFLRERERKTSTLIIWFFVCGANFNPNHFFFLIIQLKRTISTPCV